MLVSVSANCRRTCAVCPNTYMSFTYMSLYTIKEDSCMANAKTTGEGKPNALY